MLAKFFLGFSALLFVGYGLACLASPAIVADATGMKLATGTAAAEVRAMYGGLQTAVGLLALAGLLRDELRGPMLLCLGMLFFGLASGRLLGIVVESDPGAYNFVAFGYELFSAGVSFWLLTKTKVAGTEATAAV